MRALHFNANAICCQINVNKGIIDWQSVARLAICIYVGSSGRGGVMRARSWNYINAFTTNNVDSSSIHVHVYMCKLASRHADEQKIQIANSNIIIIISELNKSLINALALCSVLISSEFLCVCLLR